MHAKFRGHCRIRKAGAVVLKEKTLKPRPSEKEII